MTLGLIDQWRIKCLQEQVKEDDKEFGEHHLEVVNFIKEEDRETLEMEENAYYAHGSHVMELCERLAEMEEVERIELSPTTPTLPTTGTDHLGYLLMKLKYT